MTDSSWSSLHRAVEQEDAEELRRLLGQGADPDESDPHGMSLLHHAVDIEIDGAAQTGSHMMTGVTKVLIDAGSNPFRRWRGATAFDDARERGHTKAAGLLAEHMKASTTGRTIGKALTASLDVDVFPDWEFHALIGAGSETARLTLESWPFPPTTKSEWAESVCTERDLIVNNVLNMLLGYPHGFQGDSFTNRIGSSERDVATALAVWRDEASLEGGGKGFFNRLR